MLKERTILKGEKMATIKKAAKKPAAKKPAAKKAPAKTTAKKPAAKAASKKAPAAKKATVKTTVKKTPAKKPAAKATAAKKAAVKKPAAKAATTKVATKSAATKSASAKKTAAPKAKAVSTVKSAAKTAIKKPVDNLDANLKYMNLFDAYTQGKLPFAQGYIVSSFFNDTSAYSIYEIVSYAGVKEIFVTDTGLQFVTGGKKLYVLVEPDTYHQKPVEPVSRAEGERIPKRFNELDTIIAKNQSRIMVAKEPNESYGSFTILKPTGINFAVVFYQLPDLYESLANFFEKSLNIQRKVPQSDARKAAQQIASVLKKSMCFEGEYQ